MNRRAARLALAAVAVVIVAAAASLGWWSLDLRWRPRTITRDGAQAAELLRTAGWVSPGLSDRKVLYMVSYRSCTDCIRFEREQFPAFHAAGVDTRVIMVALRSISTPAERSGVAELWANRDWNAYERWTAMPVAAWTAAGLPVADDVPARAALVEKGRVLVERLAPILRENRVSKTFHFPTLVWLDAQGRLRGCNCENPATYRHVRAELGVTG